MTLRGGPGLKTGLIALATGIVLAVSGCSQSGNDATDTAVSETSDKTVASLIAGDDRFTVIADVLNETGVASVFDGAGAYTVLAPTNEALGALTDAGAGVPEAERRVVLIALLRNHILPGEITPASIREAIEASGTGVEMRNLAGGIITFTLDDDAIAVAGEDGLSGRVQGDTLLGSNGAIIPVDAPLAPLPGGE